MNKVLGMDLPIILNSARQEQTISTNHRSPPEWMPSVEDWKTTKKNVFWTDNGNFCDLRENTLQQRNVRGVSSRNRSRDECV